MVPIFLDLTDSRGHGTYVDNDEVIASVAGVVERVNKLVTVRPLRTRYVQRKLKLS
jgi:exosome complex component RRP4